MKLLMVIISSLLILIVAIILGFRLLNSGVEFPQLEEKWWGASQPESAETGKENDVVVIEEMKQIHFPDQEIEELKRRLNQTRFFQPLEGTHWEYGANIEDLKKLVKYWKEEFDWRKQEKLLNTFKHFTATINGIKVHYLHVKPEIKAEKVIPIVLIHGWPGSFYEFYKIIPLLTSQNSGSSFTFEVICPSLPGYVFSEAPHKPGLDPLLMAKMFIKLMARLGYKSYYVQGGDWGALIARSMGVMDSSHVKGVHLNMLAAFPPYGLFSLLFAHLFPSWSLGSVQEQQKVLPVKDMFFKLLRETGYSHLQATKPESIGVALNESPVGLAAYIIEKFFTASGCKSNDSLACLESKFTRDELLTNVMLYWLTGSITSAMRLYKEIRFDRSEAYPLSVPTGCADFPDELVRSPHSWLSVIYPNIVHYTEMPRGGHFAALQEPQLLANDIWKFVTKVERTPST